MYTSSICMWSHLSVRAANPLKKRAVLPGVSCSFDEGRTKLLDARIRFQPTSSGPHYLHTFQFAGLQSSTPVEQTALTRTALVRARILGRASEYCHRHRYPPPSFSPMACLHSRLSVPRRGRALPRLSSSHTRYLLPVHADPLHPTSTSPKHPAKFTTYGSGQLAPGPWFHCTRDLARAKPHGGRRSVILRVSHPESSLHASRPTRRCLVEEKKLKPELANFRLLTDAHALSTSLLPHLGL